MTLLDTSKNLLLPDAIDSITLSSVDSFFTDENSLLHLLRLRLYVIMQILFGGHVLIPEGWALDSMTFLAVASEVITALSNITNHQLHPFIMEVKRDGDYIQIFDEYLRRPNCRWTGFHPQLDEPDKCLEIANQISTVVRGTPNYDLITITFADALDNERVAVAISNVATYFSLNPKNRTTRVRVDPVDFHRIFVGCARRFAKYLRQQNNNSEIPVTSFLNHLEEAGVSFRGASAAITYVEKCKPLECESREIHDTLMRIISFAYMRTTTRAISRAIGITPALTTPALSDRSSETDWLSDDIMSLRTEEGWGTLVLFCN